MISLLVSLLISSNASGKTLVRCQPGTLVPMAVYSGPLIADDVNTVCHATFNGTAIQDSKGCAWTMQGTVPQVSRSGKTPPGAGPFSASNYYYLGSGNDALDFAGDFSICVVHTPTAGANYLVSDGAYNVSGYYLQVTTSSATFNMSGGAGVNASVFPSTQVVGVNVLCVGRSGNTAYAKSNLGATLNAAISSYAPATATIARIGTASAGANPFAGTIYELWFSTTAASDAVFTAIANRVKLRAGITAW